ncbi:MAG: hydroxyacid dehydrogenase [Lachnospiraceae bacterium]|nr:hydroxyacid dehydrogenase [Lachnospiraceae bacterium]
MNLLITGSFSLSPEDELRLKGCGYHITKIEREDAEHIPDSNIYDIVVCNFLFIHHDINEFRNLKAVQLLSAGTDRMPMDYAAEKGIEVRNARGVYSIPIAEFTVMAVLEAYKTPSFFYENQKKRKWEKNRNLHEISRSRICIFGTGSVGMETAKRFSGFTDNIFGIDIDTKPRKYFKEIYEPDFAREIVQTCDIIILTLPLSEETYHMINTEFLEYVKDDAVLVNVARGGLIDEDALMNSLDQGKFRKVILDAFENEPLDEEYWGWNADRVRIIPHNAYVSAENVGRLRKVVMNALEEWSVRNID